MRKNLNLRANIALGLIFAFLLNTFGPMPMAQAGPAFSGADEFRLPAPGVMVHLSPEFNPPILKGIKVHPDNPFRFDFILDQGDSLQNQKQLKTESTKLIKYFLASLTIPEQDLWVNLSPYEKDRIIPQSFGLTEMGRDLLAEDYMLKQITASLIYPEDAIGKKFWKRIYEEAHKKFGTTNIPVNTFNKVWIVPEKAVVYENAKAGTAYVVEAKLKVMLEQDYLSLSRHSERSEESSSTVIPAKAGIQDTSALGSQIVRETQSSTLSSEKRLGSLLAKSVLQEIVIPELTREVNEDRNFAQLRQVYNSLILATWYKKKIKDSILAQVYDDKNKIQGLSPTSGHVQVEAIYQRYLQAFKKGVFNYIKEESDSLTQETIPRKYFSGGFSAYGISDRAMNIVEEVSPVMREEIDQTVGRTRPLLISTSVISAGVLWKKQTKKPQGKERKTLDGLTILRFAHSMKLTGGLEIYLSELDGKLLQRNKITIIRVFYTTDQTLRKTETKLGKGRLIQIPVVYNPEATSVVTSVEDLIKARIISFVKRNGLDDQVRRILALKNPQKVLKLVPVVRRYYQSRFPHEFLQIKLKEALRMYKADLIVNHELGLLNEGLIINKLGSENNIPVVVQFHGANRLISQDKVFTGALAKVSGHVATVSSLDIPDELKDKTTVLWDGIDTDFLDPRKVTVEQEDNLKNELGIQPRDKVVLLPARIDPLKGQLDILKVLLISKQHNIKYKVFLAGENQSKQYHSQIEAWSTDHNLRGEVFLTGNLPKDKLRVMYKISDVVVLPSASEGTGRVLLEAQAMNIPVVAYSNDGMKEAVINGKTGYLVHDKDYVGLAAAIEILLKDKELSKTMGEAGREFVISKFSLTALAQRHEQYYRDIIDSFIKARSGENGDSVQLAQPQPSPKDRAMKAVESISSRIMDLYEIGDSKKFRKQLSDLGIVPDELIGEMKGYIEKYLRGKVTNTVFQEILPSGSQKRVFQADFLDFVVGFAYKFGQNISEKLPDSQLPESFNIAYERGGDVVGDIFYLKDVLLKYKDTQGKEQQIRVPYLLVQDKLIEFGARIRQLEQEGTQEARELIKDLYRQFIEIHKKMFSRGFLNWDVKIAINYGVTRDNRVVLLDTGGITKEKREPLISWYIPAFYGIQAPDYKKELSLSVINELWEKDLDSILRSTFVNPDLEAPLTEIVKNAVRKVLKIEDSAQLATVAVDRAMNAEAEAQALIDRLRGRIILGKNGVEYEVIPERFRYFVDIFLKRISDGLLIGNNQGGDNQGIMKFRVKEDGSIYDVEIYLNGHLEGQGLAKGLYKLLSDFLPDGANLEEDVSNEASRKMLVEKCDMVGNEIFYKPKGLRIIEQGQPMQGEILLEDVLAETLIGHLIKNEETSFTNLIILYQPKPGSRIYRGLMALQEILKAPRKDGVLPPLFQFHAVKFQVSRDHAMTSSQNDLAQSTSSKGGIDLTPAHMNVEVKKEIASSLGSIPRNDTSDGIQFHLSPAMLAQLQNAPGFVPVIINIRPMTDLKRFLEVQ